MSTTSLRCAPTISQSEAARGALLDAAGRGDAETVESLLQQGADPDVRSAQGETALHLAVGHGHAQAAACLLAYGADHRLVDQSGHTPLSLNYTNLSTLHAIRQRYHRFPTPDRAGATPCSQQAIDWAGELDRKGFLRLPGLIEPTMLACMQSDFEAFARNLEAKVARGEGCLQHYDDEEHWWPKDRAYVSNNAFKHSRQLVKFCCHEPLLEIANLYLGKVAYIQRGVAMRYLPSESTDNDMFGWHHDMEDMRLKVMILLTDVGEHDQYMSYVVGSHKIFHPLVMFLKNKCSLEYCRKQLGQIEIDHTIGRAGDVFLFDSNGAHRGNRRPQANIRDAFFVEYTADKSDIWGGDVPRDVFDDLPLRGANPFERMMAVEKKWNLPVTRKAPTWIENLPRVEAWL